MNHLAADGDRLGPLDDKTDHGLVDCCKLMVRHLASNDQDAGCLRCSRLGTRAGSRLNDLVQDIAHSLTIPQPTVLSTR